MSTRYGRYCRGQYDGFLKDESQQEATSDAVNDDVIQKLLQAKGQIFSVLGKSFSHLVPFPAIAARIWRISVIWIIDPNSHDRIVIVSKKWKKELNRRLWHQALSQFGQA
ncbi:hypothetical protein NIBR502774_18680 (plasmid) [Rhizobium sp. NIBRBAC000502774]|nr:hypothetical protein NIBR502774_18680 [Rhizobium sp. NIBRBAC000502774]